jgi:hypothetical protein
MASLSFAFWLHEAKTTQESCVNETPSALRPQRRQSKGRQEPLRHASCSESSLWIFVFSVLLHRSKPLVRRRGRGFQGIMCVFTACGSD